MTQAPSIKDALQELRDANMSYSLVSDVKNARRLEQAMRDAESALATLQPSGERLEAIARRLKSRIGSGRMVTVGPGLYEDISEAADAILASGLVQDEAAIRADEREKCAKIADLFVNHDAEYGAKYHDEAFKFDNRWLRSKTIADAIRSARDGGEG